VVLASNFIDSHLPFFILSLLGFAFAAYLFAKGIKEQKHILKWLSAISFLLIASISWYLFYEGGYEKMVNFDFPFTFVDKSPLLFVFFFHGFVFSILLLRKGIIQQRASHKWLSLLLFLYAMYISPYMLGYSGWYSRKYTREILYYLPLMQVLLIGPVIYFYTQSLLNRAFRLTKKDVIHFVPFILYSIYSLIVFVGDKLILDEIYFYKDGRDKDLSNWYQVSGVISMTFYLILSLRFYVNYRKLAFDRVSFAESILFRWIRNFMIAFLVILVLRVLFFFTNPEWGEFGSQFWHYIFFSFVFYYISINGYSNAVKITAMQGVNNDEVNVFEEETSEHLEEIPPTEEKDIQEWKEKISVLIADKRLFENPRLTLSDVAKELETNTKTVSTAVNSGFQMNFNDFINHHRIEAVKMKLQKGEHQTTTLLGIAYDCGFNSKATFNRAFKKSTSFSPKDYLEKMS
jgi:AraC-like DNA-binding protein